MSEVCEPAAPAHGGRASCCPPLFPQSQRGQQGEAAQGAFCGHGLGAGLAERDQLFCLSAVVWGRCRLR